MNLEKQKQKQKNESASSLLLVMVITLINVMVFILNGYALLMIYKWFIQSQFQLPDISITFAVGVILAVSLLKESKDVENTKISELLVRNILRPVIFLLIAFIAKLIV